MSNFKVGQKVVATQTQETKNENFQIIKGNIYTIANLLPMRAGGKCLHCGNKSTMVVIQETEESRWCICEFEPIIYSKSVNFEVIANFSPKPERPDVPAKQPEPQTA